MAAQILLWDVMSTLVYDPYLVELPGFFDLSWQELFARKHPTAWVDFELGRLTEEEFFAIFLPGHAPIDIEAFHQMLRGAYRYLPGMEALLEELAGEGVAMHVLSNYPVWYELLEEALGLSRHVTWSFVSCRMGVRKPDAAIYTRAAEALGVAPSRCLFIDDRGSNCKGAAQVGMEAVRFEDEAGVRQALVERGFLRS